mgnify:CR=1 FL=1
MKNVVNDELRKKQLEMEKRIKKEIEDPNFLNMYTRKTLREVMLALFPYESVTHPVNRAFNGMTKARMYRRLLGYAILKRWEI